MQDAGYELRRIPVPRTSPHKLGIQRMKVGLLTLLRGEAGRKRADERICRCCTRRVSGLVSAWFECSGLASAHRLPRRLIAPTTSVGLASLSSISSAPASVALWRFVGSRLALKTSTAAPALDSRTSPISSAPLPSGSPRSKTATSHLTVATWPRASASDPAWAITSRSGSRPSKAVIRCLKSAWSSTSMTRVRTARSSPDTPILSTVLVAVSAPSFPAPPRS
jgi:hypothetical protein